MSDPAPHPAPTTPTADDLLRTYLADRDAPCPCCNYNLRGLQSSRCPECNQDIHLAINLSEPRLGLYLAALCGLLAGMGMAAIFLAIITYFLLSENGVPSGDELLRIAGIPAISLVFLTILFIIARRASNRRWFQTAPLSQRLFAVLGCWAATTGCVAWFLWAVL